MHCLQDTIESHKSPNACNINSVYVCLSVFTWAEQTNGFCTCGFSHNGIKSQHSFQTSLLGNLLWPLFEGLPTPHLWPLQRFLQKTPRKSDGEMNSRCGVQLFVFILVLNVVFLLKDHLKPADKEDLGFRLQRTSNLYLLYISIWIIIVLYCFPKNLTEKSIPNIMTNKSLFQQETQQKHARKLLRYNIAVQYPLSGSEYSLNSNNEPKALLRTLSGKDDSPVTDIRQWIHCNT